MCEYKTEREPVEYYILNCKLYDEERDALRRRVIIMDGYYYMTLLIINDIMKLRKWSIQLNHRSYCRRNIGEKTFSNGGTGLDFILLDLDPKFLHLDSGPIRQQLSWIFCSIQSDTYYYYIKFVSISFQSGINLQNPFSIKTKTDILECYDQEGWKKSGLWFDHCRPNWPHILKPWIFIHVTHIQVEQNVIKILNHYKMLWN